METLEYDVGHITTQTFKTINNKFKFTNLIMLQNIGRQHIYVSDGVDFDIDNNEGWLIAPGDTFKSTTGTVYIRPGVKEIKITVLGAPNA